MRVMAIPDLHAWPTTDARPGEPNRREEWLRVTEHLVELAVREEVALAVAPGDFFVNSRPPAQAVIDINRFFAQLEYEHGIRVVGVSGNHDSAGAQRGPVDVLAELAISRWGSTGLTEHHLNLDREGGRGARVHVVTLPWMPPGRIKAEYGSLKGMLEEARRILEAGRSFTDYSILVGHWAVKGCVTSNGVRIVDQEPTLELEDLYRLPVDAIILGHIHKPQVFEGPFPILHTGALLRNSFVEEHDERKVAIVDLAAKEIAWHPIPARRYFTWRLEEEELTAGSYSASAEAKNAICRIVYTATEEVHRQVDGRALLEALKKAEPYHITGVYPQIVRSHRVRAAGVSEKASQGDALRQWLDLQSGLSEELKKAVMEEARQLSIIED